MKVKCISDCAGDYWDLTIGEEYEAIKEYNMNYGIENGVKLYQKRLIVIDNTGEEYPYLLECFDYVEGSINKNEEDLIKEYYVENKSSLIDGEKEAIQLAWETDNN